MKHAPPASRDRNAAKARVAGRQLLDLAVDVVAPLVVYLVLSAAGAPAYLALTVGGILVGAKTSLGPIRSWRADRYTGFVAVTTVLAVATVLLLVAAGLPDAVAAAVGVGLAAIPVVVSLVRRGRQIDGIGLLVLAELTTSVVVTLVSDDLRFVLARPAIYTAVAGVYALATCRYGRPMMLDATKPMAAAGDPLRATAFENAWAGSAAFRTLERVMTAGLGLTLLAEAVLRVVVVYASPTPDLAVTGVVAQIPAVALFVVYVLLVRLLAVPRARSIVDAEVALLRADGPA